MAIIFLLSLYTAQNRCKGDKAGGDNQTGVYYFNQAGVEGNLAGLGLIVLLNII
ncbi:MAG TPA: hypothetical protein PKC24_14155 [Cyclobacteriaceae bacterium]|nr:hypothetical protein [Cyclobacteriaceae bacterium]